MTLVKYLQGWVGIVAITAFGNTVSCFKGHQFLAERLYTDAPSDVNALMARLFGTWTLLSAALRLYCAIFITNKGIYHLTMFSFVLSFGHFVSEALFYKTAVLTEMGIILPLVISSISFIWMAIAYSSIFHQCESPSDLKLTMEDVRITARKAKKFQ